MHDAQSSRTGIRGPRAQTLVCLVVALGILSGARAGRAADELAGSGALTSLLKEVQRLCPQSAGVSCLGGGDARGELALLASSQQVAPMSRPLSSATACAAANAGEVEGLLLALDGVTIVTDVDTRQACGDPGVTGGADLTVTERNGVAGLQCPGCSAGAYRVSDWRDALRVLFLGMHHDAGVDLSRRDCNSDVRHTIAARWSAIFGGTCVNQPCSRIEHAFRPSDRSKTTALFLDLVGLPPSPHAPFCNAAGAGPLPDPAPAAAPLSDELDLDPIRRACSPTDQVCSHDGTLGLVLPVDVPANIPDAERHPTRPCDAGVFRLLSPSADVIPPDFLCPNGRPTLFQRCFQPVRLDAGVPDAACVAPAFPVQGFLPNGITHGGVYNLAPKRSDGRYVTDANGRMLRGAFYRLHGTATDPGGGRPCAAGNPSEQLRCLAQANPCSLSMAGFDGAPDPGAAAAPIGGVVASIANVRRLLASPPDPGAYPLGARLHLNTLVGFDAALSAPQGGLASCLASESVLTTAATTVGLIPLGGAASCADFDERACGTTLLNRNACLKRTLNFCPTIDWVTVGPLETDVGLAIALAGQGSDLEGDRIEYLWTATAGQVEDREASTTRYRCTTAGRQVVTFTVWDGLCPTTMDVVVVCHPR